MIDLIIGNITKIHNVDCIVCESNSFASSESKSHKYINNSIGNNSKEDIKNILLKSNVSPGDIFEIDSGKLKSKNIKKIIYCISCKFPGEYITYSTIEKCLKNIFEYCISKKYKKISIPGIGTNLSGLDISVISLIYKKYITNYHVNFNKIFIVDTDPNFINALYAKIEIEKVKKYEIKSSGSSTE